MTEPALHTLQRRLCPWLKGSLSRLEAAYAAQRLGHAWLVGGPAGSGKLNLALVFARRLLERGAKQQDPPVLSAEDAVAAYADRHAPADHHPDLHWLFPEEDKTAIAVEQIRELGEALSLKAHAGGAKVVIFEPADGMTTAAANALLKTLEEPSADTYLLLLADQPNRLPATIRSRCQRLDLPRPTPEEVASWLGVKPEDMAAAWTLTGGSPLEAAAVMAEDRSNETNKLSEQLVLISQDKASIHAIVDAWVKADPELALTWLTRELHRQIRARIAPGSTSVTDRAAVALHNAWRDLTLRRLFEQHEKTDRLLSLVGSGVNLELGLQALLLGFQAQRGST
jgi:DNA polymerase III subunit delta'